MSLVGFTRLGSLTAPSVTGSASDLPTLVKYEDFTYTMLTSLDSGGGDLRFSSDEAGTTQLACEVVKFTKATGDVVWVKVPSVATGALIHVWGDNTGATQPAVDAAFGRNAVWSDFEVNYHFNSAGVLIDATGNHDLTQFGTPTSATGQVGDAVSCAGSYANRFEAVGYKGIAGNSARTVTLWSLSSASQDRGITTWGTLASGERYSIRLDAGRLRTEIDGSYKYTNAAVSDGTFKRLSSVYDGTTWPAGLTHRTNGTTDVGYTSGNTITLNTGSNSDLIVGAYSNLSQPATTYGSNRTDEFAIRAFALSQEQDLIEYDNQSAVGAWWTATDAALPVQGFTRLGSLTAPSVTGSAANLPALVKFEDFTATMLASLDSGGGNLRFSSDLAGATQLACEVVKFTKATGDVVWVKVPSVSTGALIYVWGNNTGATQPAVGAEFGRNAVWSDRIFTYNGSTGVDSAGNYDLAVNSTTAATVNGFDGFDTVGSYQSSASPPDLDIGTPTGYRWGGWLNLDAAQSNWSGLFSITTPGTTNGLFSFQRSSSSDDLRVYHSGGYITLTGAYAALIGGVKRVDFLYTLSNNTVALYVDGVFVVSASGIGANLVTIQSTSVMYIGASRDPNVSEGIYADVTMQTNIVAPSQISIEYSNQSAAGAWWTAADAPSGGAIELTPTTINSNSQSFNPLIQYASLLALSPGVVDSASSSLNPVIQYSASLLLAPSAVNSASSALNPTLQYASVVLLEPSVVNSSSSTLNPNISFSAALNIFPTIVNSSSISLDPVVKYISALDLLPGAVNSNSLSLDPVVNYSSILNIAPNVVNSNSVSFNPSIDYTSALIISPVTVDSSSVSLDPLVEYKAVINITSQLINSASVSLNPSISTGATQDVGLVSAGFAADLYSVKYQLSNITVNFKG